MQMELLLNLYNNPPFLSLFINEDIASFFVQNNQLGTLCEAVIICTTKCEHYDDYQRKDNKFCKIISASARNATLRWLPCSQKVPHVSSE